MQRDDTAMSFLYFLRFVIFFPSYIIDRISWPIRPMNSLYWDQKTFYSFDIEINILNVYFIFIFYIFLLLFFCNVIIDKIFYSFNLCDY